MGMVLWSVESVPIKVTWLNPMRKSLSKWMESMRFEWIEVNRTIWGEMSDLKDLMRSTLWESPYGRVKVNPIEVTWCEWKSMSLSKWMESMRNEWIELEWMNRGEMSEWTLWEWSYESIESVPIEVTWLNPMRMSLSKWMESMRFEWIEVNRTIRGEMSDLKDLMRSTLWESPYGQKKVNPMRVTWVNPMGKSLWVENECPYQFDLIDLSEKVPMFSWMNVPMRVTWNNPMGKSLWVERGQPYESDLSESENECPYQNDQIWWEMNE